MNRQTVQANFFVAAMLALGGGVLWRWQHSRAIATPAPPIRFEDSANGLRPAVEKEQVEARNAIEGQLKAFKQNDYNRAMSFQSMGLRGRFPNPNSLRLMITHFYPAFAHYKSANFGHVLSSIDGSTLLVPIEVGGANGSSIPAHYYLHKENGQYRVSGVDVGFYGRQRPFRSRPWPQPPSLPGHDRPKSEVADAQVH